ncbi:MAG: thiamine-phosphate kinase [Candidatus Hydrothermarchaeales archaeon]
MKLSSLGEHKIVEMFEKHFGRRKCKDVLVSIGDDCAVLRLGDGECLLISTDTILQETHIPKEMTPAQIGGYAVNVVLSDIAAMGGSPIGMVFSIALPPGLDEDFVDRLAGGVESAAEEHGTCIVGGDTQEAREITITGTAFGRVKEKNILLRSGARVSDLICVTGDIGSAAAGFYCLTQGLPCKKRFIERALGPKARLEEGKIISKCASSCVDISDGLAWSIHEIARLSNVGSLIYEEKIPVDSELGGVSRLSGVSQREMVFYKGGDFELLFTVPPEKYEGLEEELKKLGSKMVVIGQITRGGNKVVDKNGKKLELEKRGWEAFTKDIFLLL